MTGVYSSGCFKLAAKPIVQLRGASKPLEELIEQLPMFKSTASVKHSNNRLNPPPAIRIDLERRTANGIFREEKYLYAGYAFLTVDQLLRRLHNRGVTIGKRGKTQLIMALQV